MIYNTNGQTLDLNLPVVMAIINLTNDSFYTHSRFNSEKLVLEKIEQFLKEGAKIIDIGAVSSRPFADDVSEENELNEIIPIIKSIKRQFPEVLLSIDTYRTSVAKQAIDIGADLINDIRAGADPGMFELMAKNPNIPYVIMHMQGTPQTMQIEPHYDDLMLEILTFFKKRVVKLKELGCHQIILDPGIGFGKSIEHNFSIVKNLKYLEIFDLPVLVGLSRKSMVYKTLNIIPEHSLNGTSAMHMYALLNGAKVLRVHDVNEAKECIALYKSYISVS